MKKLVAYFSAEGNTRILAEKIADVSGSDIFEIVPEVPYTAKDVNWKNPLARCNREKAGRKDVPVKGEIENFSEYDTVFIGFPIWYYQAPNVIHTFCRNYDWKGKKVVLFATSGGSGIGKTAEKLSESMPGNPEIIAAGVFSPHEGKEALSGWINDIL